MKGSDGEFTTCKHLFKRDTVGARSASLHFRCEVFSHELYFCLIFWEILVADSGQFKLFPEITL